MDKHKDLTLRIWRALFKGKEPLAYTRRIWPDPKPEILSAILKELER